MTEDILELIQSFVPKAEEQGANEAEFYALDRSEKTVNLETSALKSATASRVQGVGIRVLVNKSLGFASSNSFDKNRISAAIQDAISIAKTTPPMNHYFFSSAQKIKSVKDLYDEDTANLAMNEVIEYGKTLLKHVADQDSRVSIQAGMISSRIDKHTIATSTGIASSERKTAVSWRLMGWAVDGSDIGSFVYEPGSVVSVNDLNLENGAKMFTQQALQNLGAKKGESFKGTAVLSPNAVYDLIEMLVSSAMATVIHAGSSFLQDKLGERIAVPELTMTENGTTPNIPSNSSFDREGFPHHLLKIVDSGIFKGVLHNTFTANKDGVVSTGHANGGFRSAPGIGITHLEIHKGEIGFDEMLSEVDKGILIQRISMSPDITSGDFSGVMKGGQLIRNGEIKMVLNEMTITGNLYDCLKSISGISKEQKSLRVPSESRLFPYIRIEGLDFAS